MKDLADELVAIVPTLRQQHLYYSASVCFRAAEFLREYCEGHKTPIRVKTNYDFIVSKKPEELAELLVQKLGCNYCIGFNVPCNNRCKEYWLDWLKQEVDDADTRRSYHSLHGENRISPVD